MEHRPCRYFPRSRPVANIFDGPREHPQQVLLLRAGSRPCSTTSASRAHAGPSSPSSPCQPPLNYIMSLTPETQSVTVTTPPPRLPPRARLGLPRLAGRFGAPPSTMLFLRHGGVCSSTTPRCRAAWYRACSTTRDGLDMQSLSSLTLTYVPILPHHPSSHLQSAEERPFVHDLSPDSSLIHEAAGDPHKVRRRSSSAAPLPLCANGLTFFLSLLLLCIGFGLSTSTTPSLSQALSTTPAPASNCGSATVPPLPLQRCLIDTHKSFPVGAAPRAYKQSSQGWHVHPDPVPSPTSAARADRALFVASLGQGRHCDDLDGIKASPQAAV